MGRDGLESLGGELQRDDSSGDERREEDWLTHTRTTTHKLSHDTQSEGVLHKYGANNENAGGFILNTAANN